MKQIKLTRGELKRLLLAYSNVGGLNIERIMVVCQDLNHADDDDLLEIYNAFCRYLKVSGLRIYRMDNFHLMDFRDAVEAKRLSENVDLDDRYYAIELSGYCGYKSFNDLRCFLEYRMFLNLQNINDMLEYAFDETIYEGEEDE
jgi:hypothetical protein